jgi:hypothetical protein
MRIERMMSNSNGTQVRVVVIIDESGPKLERAIARLANKAQAKRRGLAGGPRSVSALDGAIRVTVIPVVPAAVASKTVIS